LLDFGLEGKVAIVAGSGPGLGRSCALGLAEAGAVVACVDIDRARASALAGEIRAGGGRAAEFQSDLRRMAEADEVVSEVAEEFGSLYAVVDVIGEIRYGRAVDLSDDDWEYSLDAVLRQFFNLGRAAGRYLTKQGEGGSLVSISSVSGVAGAPFHAPYGAAKAGLISLTRSLAIELAPAGIRVNNVAPGAVATPRVVDRLGGRSPDGLPLRSRAPLGRMGEPDEIAKVVVFLSSDLASYVSGQTVIVDGGATAEFALGAMDPDQIPDNASLEQPR
jgi:NAD(P)-dependent dehydrogenase (short-subunit alcohol dehydrogenase family)